LPQPVTCRVVPAGDRAAAQSARPVPWAPGADRAAGADPPRVIRPHLDLEFAPAHRRAP
jgi:hypothetical protein